MPLFIKLIYFPVCILLLLHIAEDRKVEFKMVNRGIISLLAKCLGRETMDLVTAAVLFLHRLSIYIENKEEMVRIILVYVKKNVTIRLSSFLFF